jgi:hypothetical protein
MKKGIPPAPGGEHHPHPETGPVAQGVWHRVLLVEGLIGLGEGKSFLETMVCTRKFASKHRECTFLGKCYWKNDNQPWNSVVSDCFKFQTQINSFTENYVLYYMYHQITMFIQFFPKTNSKEETTPGSASSFDFLSITRQSVLSSWWSCLLFHPFGAILVIKSS